MGDVTRLRRAALNDVPGMLRTLADDIESGKPEAKSVIVIIPMEGDWPAVYGFGEHLGNYGNVAVCELAKAWFVKQVTALSPAYD